MVDDCTGISSQPAKIAKEANNPGTLFLLMTYS